MAACFGTINHVRRRRTCREIRLDEINRFTGIAVCRQMCFDTLYKTYTCATTANSICWQMNLASKDGKKDAKPGKDDALVRELSKHKLRSK